MSDSSIGDRRRRAAYLRDLVPGMVGYVVSILGVMFFADLETESPWRFAWFALPLGFALLVLRAVVRHLGRVDEYQRSEQTTVLAVGFGAAMAAAITLGFLVAAGLDAPWSPWAIYGAGMVAWALAASWRQRARR